MSAGSAGSAGMRTGASAGPSVDLPDSPSALRLAIVGAGHPTSGPLAAHTATLAHELADAGHHVTLVSWSNPPPRLIAGSEPARLHSPGDVPTFQRTVRALAWARPGSWVRAGGRLADMDAIVVMQTTPMLVPMQLALLRAARVARMNPTGRGPRSIVVLHPVVADSSRSGDRQLVATLIRRVDSVVVHTEDQARLATELGALHVRHLDLPPRLPGGAPLPHVESDGPTRVLALGVIRDTKGVDLLLEAARQAPGVRITVAGEMSGEAGRRIKELAREPELRDRVEVHGGHVPSDRIPELLARHDVLAATHREATTSQQVLLARRHGLPVLASAVGVFAEQVRDGIDGILVPPGQVDPIVTALHALSDRSYAARLRQSVRPVDEAGPWAHYVGALEALAAIESAAPLPAEATTDPDDGAGSAQSVGGAGSGAGDALGGVSGWSQRLRSNVSGLRARARATEILDLRPTDFPQAIRASDVLTADDDARDARDFAQDLGLPRCADAVAAWAALGALAAIVRIGDADSKRDTVIVDESGSRSPLSRWARALGFAPVELELTGRRGSVEVLDVDTASLDVLSRIHPGGCSADDIDHALSQASWALRSGGLFVSTLPLGEDDPDWALTPADIRGVLARAGDLGLALVGDLDGDLLARMRRTTPAQGGDPVAYGILRMTFRRR